MPKAFISEDDIEQSILNLFEQEKLGYNILRLDASPEKWKFCQMVLVEAIKRMCPS